MNPAKLAALSDELTKAVDDALAAGDFRAAYEAIDAVQPVPSYSAHVDAELDKAAGSAQLLGVTETDTSETISAARKALYEIIAPRPGRDYDARVLDAYARELDAMAGPRVELDWSSVREALEKAKDWLVDDDMPPADAQKFMDYVLTILKSKIAAPDKIKTLTTAELNSLLDDLKAKLSAKVASAVAAAANMLALALQMAERAAATVDFDARIAAFIEAVGDRVERDVNRILGDGARVLRLRRAGAKITPADATSLLVAAVYMGFDDVMHLALTLGADIDAPSPKDALRRPALLLAL